LQELIARGVNGEVQAAREALAKLEARLDFSGEVPEDAKDLFHGVKVTKGGIARPVATFDGGGPGVSSFVKWAIASRLGVDGTWKDAGGNKVTLLLEVTADSVAGLAGVAQHIAASFGALWNEFTRLPGATTNDARLFMRGLYDGMMHDERKDGERLPSRTPARPKRVRGKRNIVNAPGLGIHPYSVAIEFGRRIRLTAPVETLCHELRELEEQSRQG
jgi:hypothetical protein